jgi:hypothetical protein
MNQTLKPGYEIVHTVTDYYDGPRGGLADYNRQPHLYESIWDDLEANYKNSFNLFPINLAVFNLAMESWAIWRKYERALHRGETTQEHHPALPADRNRYDILEHLLKNELSTSGIKPIVVHGEFDVINDANYDGIGLRPMQVKWDVVRC